MRFSALLLLAGLFTGTLSAASVTWATSGVVAGPDGNAFTDGMAYLVSVPTATAPTYTVVNGTGRWNMNSGSIISAAGYNGTDWGSGYTVDTPPGSANSYYIVFVTQTTQVTDLNDLFEGTKVAVSAAGRYLEYSLTPGATPDATIVFDNTTGEWQTIVPEPTVMALLALGVAGMALRRKIA